MLVQTVIMNVRKSLVQATAMNDSYALAKANFMLDSLYKYELNEDRNAAHQGEIIALMEWASALRVRLA